MVRWTGQREGLVTPAATAARGSARRGVAGQGNFLPHTAGDVQAVALVHPGGGVADVGVERVAVPGRLLGAVRSGDHGERAGYAGAGGGGPGYRRPVGGAASVAVRLGRGVRDE